MGRIFKKDEIKIGDYIKSNACTIWYEVIDFCGENWALSRHRNLKKEEWHNIKGIGLHSIDHVSKKRPPDDRKIVCKKGRNFYDKMFQKIYNDG